MNKKEANQPNQDKTTNLNIYQKLQQVQRKVGQLEKDQLNKFQNYKYVAEYDILRTLKPLLNDQNLVLTFDDNSNQVIYAEEGTTDKGKKEWIVKYLKRMTLTNANNPTEQLTYELWATGQNADIAKAKGSAETYAIKYFLMKFFLIPTSDNLDPDKDSETTEKPVEKSSKTSKKTITPEQVQELYDLFVSKRGTDRQIQTNFLAEVDKIMVKYGMVGTTNTGNFRIRLAILTPADYQSLMNYLNNLPDSK